MIKYDFNVNENERRRILSLHENATKNNYLLVEQDMASTLTPPEPLELNLENVFESGKFVISNTRSIDDAVAKINDYSQKYSNSFKIVVTIESSESRVTQAQGEGYLSKQRLDTVKKYLTGKLPKDIKLVEQNMGAQGPAWDPNGGISKDDPRYKKWQYVKLSVKGIFDICKLKATQTDGTTGEAPTFISFDKTFKVTGVGNKIINLTFDCKQMPDFVRISYGGNIVKQGWIGANYPPYQILVGTFVNYFGDKNGIGIKTPLKDIDLETAAKFLSGFERGPKLALVNMFPDAKYGDEKGIQFFALNKQIVPKIPNGNQILPSVTTFPIQLQEGTDDLRIQIYSPFGMTQWSFQASCEQE